MIVYGYEISYEKIPEISMREFKEDEIDFEIDKETEEVLSSFGVVGRWFISFSAAKRELINEIQMIIDDTKQILIKTKALKKSDIKKDFPIARVL